MTSSMPSTTSKMMHEEDIFDGFNLGQLDDLLF